MDDDIAIKVENVSKKFSRSLKRSMLYGVKDIGRNALGMGSHPERLRKGEFWAVDDVSFEVKKGEALGLIGPNGSGKTTLLKMLNGIFWPDKGKITINGSVGALIAVGAGFHPMLTGRENIYINAAILGMTKEETDEKYDDIVKFADIGDFLDTPVKFYSSGMFVRLGFAVAIHCEPDVLLVDEILSVGDIGFRVKCINTIMKQLDSMAVVFVSHSMPQIGRFCTSAALLNQGNIVNYSSDVPSVISQYNNLFNTSYVQIIKIRENKITEILINGDCSKEITVNYRDSLEFLLKLQIEADIKNIEISIVFMSQDSQAVSQINSRYSKIDIENNSPKLNVGIKIPEINLSPGVYSLQIYVYDSKTNEIICGDRESIKINVLADFISWAPTQLNASWNIKK